MTMIDSSTFDSLTMVIMPQSTADMVQAVKFVSQHNISLSVKTSGHSYFGASTMKNKLLSYLVKFPK